jgi:small GTP-binding protein
VIQKKVCLMGSFATGKTSLVSRFVKSIFSERYLTTVGVKIDKKEIDLGGQAVSLILWDLHGEDELQTLRTSYLRGSSGYLLVVDGTRRATLDTAIDLQRDAEACLGRIPFVLALNKSDLRPDWDLPDSIVEGLAAQGWTIVRTSAKTGEGVEDALRTLARLMIPEDPIGSA